LSLRQKYLTILTSLAPAGAVGLSMALGAATPAAASQVPTSAQPGAAEREAVSERLAVVRDVVSAIAEEAGSTVKSDGRLAFVNWSNWGRGWGWPNGWNNWHNGWNNWGNWFRNW